MISTSRLSDLFVEVADTLVDDFDVVDFLHHVTTSAAEITESSAVGLMLANHDGRLSFMAASTRGRAPAGAVPAPELRGAVPGRTPDR